MKAYLSVSFLALVASLAACQKSGATQGSSIASASSNASSAPVLMVRYANFYRGDDDETATCRIYSDSSVKITFGGLDPAPAEQTLALTGDQDESLDNEMENFDNRPGGHTPDTYGEIPSDDAALPVMGAVLSDFDAGLQIVDAAKDPVLSALVKSICQIDGPQ